LCAVALEIIAQNYLGEFPELSSLKTALEKNTEVVYFGDSVVKGSAEDLLAEFSVKKPKIKFEIIYQILFFSYYKSKYIN
jgi:hypothetical protein